MKMNRLLQLARDLLILLQEKSTSSSISSSEISAFQNSQTSIVMLRDTALMLIRFTLGVAAAISLLTAISAASAFWFVAFLSKRKSFELSPICYLLVVLLRRS